jgi:hypothetical protein
MLNIQEERLPVVDQCQTANIEYRPDPKDKEKKIEHKIPCKKIDGKFCSVYLYPFRKWSARPCPMAERTVTAEKERMLNPLKASKRGGNK